MNIAGGGLVPCTIPVCVCVCAQVYMSEEKEIEKQHRGKQGLRS